ncbi:hypothetical protein [Streptococcus ruminantium]|uniref:hypothetical protein n=1 Tax=Streptococcus ruminantium TaxID=1917441 RepID=UPI0012DFE71C|nr:hypothetical protein [Streptococcus ruminantium]
MSNRPFSRNVRLNKYQKKKGEKMKDLGYLSLTQEELAEHHGGAIFLPVWLLGKSKPVAPGKHRIPIILL